MDDDVRDAEREIRKAIRDLGYELSKVSVEGRRDEWRLELEVDVTPSESDYKVDGELK
ncbi:hypothetical protein [Haloferax sp. Atlit-12N]|uniref:hypothetical protein n=1 Tax=Haloferax sp. Atlit-12N TaxID=2077203 RepID=UPI001313DE3B|nr:hypothetical protein [Haloferax sp. Atlit-12N]